MKKTRSRWWRAVTAPMRVLLLLLLVVIPVPGASQLLAKVILERKRAVPGQVMKKEEGA